MTVNTELDLAALDVGDGLGHIHGHGAGLRVRHQATRTEHTAQAADLAHHVRGGDHGVEVEEAAGHLLDELVIADDVGAGLGGLGGLRAAGEHQDLGGLTGAVGQVDGAADQLVGLARIDVQTQHSLDRLVELVRRHALEQSDSLGAGVQVVAIDLLGRFAVLLGMLSHLSFSSQSVTVMPMERAVPSMIFMPASTSRADRSGILVSAISRI